jgi:hypothetical protein
MGIPQEKAVPLRAFRSGFCLSGGKFFDDTPNKGDVFANIFDRLFPFTPF